MAQPSAPSNGDRPEIIERRLHWQLPEVLLNMTEDGNTGLISDLIQAFQSDTRSRLVEVRRAFGMSDHKRIAAEIHSIKGSAQQMGADQFASICSDIESTLSELPTIELSECLENLERELDAVCCTMAAYLGTYEAQF